MVVENGPEEESIPTLLREALDETKELVRIEVALAKDELRAEIRAAKASAALWGTAVALLLLGVSTLISALVLGIGTSAAVVLGIVLLVLAGAAGLAGYRSLPREPLPDTKHRIEKDVRELKERVA